MLESVCLYSIVFIISCLAAMRYSKLRDVRCGQFDRLFCDYIGTNKEKKRFSIYSSQFIGVFYEILVLAPPLIIATFRGMEVGTDTQTYYENYLSYAKYSIFDYVKIREYRASAAESGFQFLMHLGYVSNLGFTFVKFISEFLILFFVWQGLKYYHDKFRIDMSAFMMFYYLFEFSYGLNAIRFSITLSIFFYSFKYVIEKKFLPYTLCCLFMSLFHQTMIICLAFYLINIYDARILRGLKKHLKAILIVTMGAMVVSLKYIVAILLPIVRTISARLSYLELSASGGFGIGVFLFIFLFLVFPILYWKKLVKNNQDWLPLLVLSTTYIPFRFLGYFNEFAVRFTRISELAILVIFCGIFQLTHIPFSTSKQFEVKNLLVRSSIILFSAVQYIVFVIVQESSNAYPFKWDM